MKKYISVAIVMIMIVLLVGCSNSTNSNTDEYVAPTAAAQKTTIAPTEQSIEIETEEETIAETKAPTTSIEWTEFSYDTKDTDGYTYKITVKLSPWILYSETDIINEAWSVVGKDNSLPTFDSWNFNKSSDNKYWKAYSHGTAAFDRGAWNSSMNDMYYCVGNLSIKNTTEGWDISSSSTRTAKAQMALLPYSGTDAIPSIAKAFYTNSSKTWWHGIDISAKMKSNSWGPVPFVIMAPENFAPNSPNGEYLEQLQTSHFEAFGITDPEPIYVDIIGKNGEKFSPIKEKE